MTLSRREVLAGVVTMPLALSALPAVALTVEEVLNDPDNPVLGNPAGDVTIAEFFDYQCGYCKRNHAALVEVVESDGNIRLVMKDWPIFGAPSIRAAQLALGGVASGEYAAAQAALMGTPGKLTEAQIESTLGNAGFDVVRLDKAYRKDRQKWDDLMARNNSQAGALGLRGTPSFIVGQTLFPGAMSKSELRKAVRKARRG